MKSEQERMEKLLKNELKKEADKTMKEVEADESLKDIALPDELDAGLRAKIEQYEAEQAAYEKLSDQDKEAIRIGREYQIQRANDGDDNDGDDGDDGNGGDEGSSGGGTDGENNNERRVVRFRKRRRMAFALVAIVAVMAMGFGMTSFGDVPFFTSVKNQIIGDRKMVQIDSGKDFNKEENKTLSSGIDNEEAAYQQIKDDFGFDAVRLQELPSGTSFLEGTVEHDLQEACLLYSFKQSIIEYRIFVNYMEKSSGYDIEDNLLSEETVKVNGQEIVIRRYKLNDSKDVQFVAQFKYKNIHYLLNAVLEENEFVDIVKKLKFN